MQVKLWISTAPDTDFTAKLIDEIPANADYPLGFDLNIGDSILRTRYRESLDRPMPMPSLPSIDDYALPHRQCLQEGPSPPDRRVEQ